MTFEEQVEKTYEQHLNDILDVAFNEDENGLVGWNREPAFCERYQMRIGAEKQLWYRIALALGYDTTAYYFWIKYSVENFIFRKPFEKGYQHPSEIEE